MFRLFANESKPMEIEYYNWKRWIKAILFFHITCYGYLLFRANSMDQIIDLSISLIHFETLTKLEFNYIKQIIFYVFLTLIILLFQFKHGTRNQITGFHPVARVIVYVLMFYSIFFFGEFGAEEFIYFQF